MGVKKKNELYLESIKQVGTAGDCEKAIKNCVRILINAHYRKKFCQKKEQTSRM